MTEQEAIERIAAAIKNIQAPTAGLWLTMDHARAKAAWNEMKAIAREDAQRQDDLIAEAAYRNRHELYWVPVDCGTRA